MMTMAMQRASRMTIRRRAVLGQVRQQQPGQREHQRGAEDPVEEEARRSGVGGLSGDGAEAVVATFAQHREHHHEQPEGDRQGHPATDTESSAGPSPANLARPAGRRRSNQDPDGQEPVQGRGLATTGAALAAYYEPTVDSLGTKNRRKSRTAALQDARG